MSLTDIIKRVQDKLGLKVDGVAGPKTWAAIAAKVGVDLDQESSSPQQTPNTERPTSNAELADTRSEKNIATLLPVVQILARTFLFSFNLFLKDAAPGVVAKITSGTRTDEEQNALYEQGRTKPGPRVTNARAGYSNHNFGVAFDVTLFSGSDPIYESPLYKNGGKIGKSLGLVWGGDWTDPNDQPHFEWHPSWADQLNESSMLAELRARKQKGMAIA